MSRIVVVGGGYGGMAAAVRLAKLGHEVTLLEAADRLGGALERLEVDGFSWERGPTRTLLPAAARDLFRKSGRPLDRELVLEHRDLVREHRFAGGTVLRLPGSSREAQHDALEELGPGLGAEWLGHVEAYAPTWDLLRREYLERPWDPSLGDRATHRVLFPRETLHRRARRALRDPRLRLVAVHEAVVAGHDPRRVPAWAGVTAYLEQRFGVWTVPAADGGMTALAHALERRLATRRVTVHTSTPADDVVVRDGRAVAVATPQGEVPADVVVCAIDPRRLPALAGHVATTVPALPATTVHLALRDEDLPVVAEETVVHGADATFLLSTGGTAPDGHAAWTVRARGRLHDDVVPALARAGVDVTDQVVRRVALTARDQVEHWHGSPWGVLWQGRGTVRARLGPRTPVPGVLAAGAHAAPGAGLPFVALSAGLVAQAVGPA
ncbi:FAD-dependent oxidoreductase [Nocardioides zeae]|uniref:FAD-dependent oxidoreductase n=1 Tax=Nocardioides imazamoxiresistens TaxID=3231893 RepID=A0ABU3PZ30_9ACTN|nr:FAD-dependent oxidoreductase [Nocardioides zeae]MDT9594490.1 FAD-dependent oxidoreductase [Nocardioides zeae]